MKTTPKPRNFILFAMGLSLVPAVIIAQSTKAPLILQIWNGSPASVAKLIGTPRIDKSHYGKPDYLQVLEFSKPGASFKKMLPSATNISMNFEGKVPKAARMTMMFSAETDVQSVLVALGMKDAKLSELKWGQDKTPEMTKYAYSYQLITYPKIKGKTISFGKSFTDGKVSFCELKIEDPW